MIPPGWRLVPCEPTPEMIAGGVRDRESYQGVVLPAAERIRSIYTACLHFSPPPPEVGDERASEATIARAIRENIRIVEFAGPQPQPAAVDLNSLFRAARAILAVLSNAAKDNAEQIATRALPDLEELFATADANLRTQFHIRVYEAALSVLSNPTGGEG